MHTDMQTKMHTDMQKTLVLIKPEAIRRNLVGRILSTYESKGLIIHHMAMIRPSRTLISNHYCMHKNQPWFDECVNYLAGKRTIALVLAGKDAISTVRRMHGAADPNEVEIGTIRNTYSMSVKRTVVHSSVDANDAEREIGLWFGDDVDDIDMYGYEMVYD